MKNIGIIILLGLVLSGCSSRDEQNDYEAARQTRDERTEIDRRVEEKRQDYTAQLGDLTFTGDPDDLTNVVLEAGTGMSLGLPLYYYFTEKEDHLQLEVHIMEEDSESHTANNIFETLVVDDIQFEDETYTVYAEEYTFNLHMYQDSIRRLRDENGAMLTPSYYVPEELEEQWYNEAREEVASSD